MAVTEGTTDADEPERVSTGEAEPTGPSSATGVDAFDAIVDVVDTPMWIVTVGAGDARAGCLVGFACQCSIDPRRFVVHLSKANRTEEVARTAETLVVHALRRDQHDLAEVFGGQSEHDDPSLQWRSSVWHEGPAGTPVLDACDWFAATVVARHDVGDHVAHVVEPLTAAGTGSSTVVFAGELPERLGFQDARDIDAGRDAEDHHDP